MIRKVKMLLDKIVETVVQEGLSWRDDRRIVELGVLAEALGKCCREVCSSALDLSNIENKITYGFASLLWGRCMEFGTSNNKVSSCEKEGSTSVRCKHKGSRSYDVFRIISYWNVEIYGKPRVATI